MRLLDLGIAQIEAALAESDDGISALSGSFAGIVGELKAMEQSVWEIPSDQAPAELVDTVESYRQAISKNVNAVVVGMQFYDQLVQRLSENTDHNLATRYGNFAMEHLVNAIMKQGGQRKNFEVKLFGGGSVLNTLMDIGDRNIQFVRDYVRTEWLHVVNEDLGGPYPRKVVYFPATGRALVKRLRSLHNDTIARRDQRYSHILDEHPVKGEVDLF